MTGNVTYRSDIDGLRALAIIPVIFFHADLGCPGGFVGVDIFFVISGFLITSLILREIKEDRFSLSRFWERRVRRILPALLVMVIVTLIAGWFLFLPADFELLGKSVISQALIVSNIHFWRETSYFSADVDTKPLLHTWSLAVEEQFYIIFPLALIAVVNWKKFPIFQSLLFLSFGSLVISIIGSYFHPSATFYLLPTRAWEITTGALIASISSKQLFKPWQNEMLGLLGFGLILFSIIYYTPKVRFPGLAAIPPCIGAGMIIFSGLTKSTYLGRLLSLKPVVFFGLISYSLYLWHWPIIVFAKYYALHDLSLGFRIVLIFACVIFATLSWIYIEKPFRERRVVKSQVRIFQFAAVTTVSLIGIGILILVQQGFPSRLPESSLRYASSRNDSAFRNETTVAQAQEGHFVKIGAPSSDLPISILIWGDSHAMAITSALDEACRRHGVSGVQATHSSTAPLIDYSGSDPFGLQGETSIFSEAVIDFIVDNQIKKVFIAAFWSNYGPPELLAQKLSATVQKIVNTGATVYLLKDAPNPNYDVPRQLALASYYQLEFDRFEISRNNYNIQNHKYNLILQEMSNLGAIILETPDYFLNGNNNYDVIRDNQVLFFDSHHLSVEGAKLLIPMLEPLVSQKK